MDASIKPSHGCLIAGWAVFIIRRARFAIIAAGRRQVGIYAPSSSQQFSTLASKDSRRMIDIALLKSELAHAAIPKRKAPRMMIHHARHFVAAADEDAR